MCASIVTPDPVSARPSRAAAPARLPRVAVLLAAHNGQKFLGELLDSLAAQSAVDLRILVSIDASTDGSEALLRQRAAQDSRIKLLPTGRRFGSAAANFLRLLREVDLQVVDHVALADQDDIWLSDKLQRACARLAQTGADAYSSNAIAFWPDGRRVLVNKAQPQRQWDFLFEGGGPGCTFLLAASLARQLQAFVLAHADELRTIHHHDWLIYAFARTRGFRWTIDSWPSVLYRQHGANQLGANRGWRAFSSRITAVLGGAGIAQALVLARVLGIEEQEFVRGFAGPGRIRFLRLASQASACRRRRRDRWLFALACLGLFIFGERADEA